MTTNMSPRIGSAAGAALKTGQYGTTELVKVPADLREKLIADVSARAGVSAAEVRQELLAKWDAALAGGASAAADHRVEAGRTTTSPEARPVIGQGHARGAVGARLFQHSMGERSAELNAVFAKLDSGAGLFNRKGDGKIGDAEVKAGGGYQALGEAVLKMNGEDRRLVTSSLSGTAKDALEPLLARHAWGVAGAAPALIDRLQGFDALTAADAKEGLSAAARALTAGKLQAPHIEALAPMLMTLVDVLHREGNLSEGAKAAIAPLLGEGWLPTPAATARSGHGTLEFKGVGGYASGTAFHQVAKVETFKHGDDGAGFVRLHFRYPSYNGFERPAFGHSSHDWNTTSESDTVYFVRDLSKLSLPSGETRAASAEEASDRFRDMIKSLEANAVAGWHEYSTGFGDAGTNHHAAVTLGACEVVMDYRHETNTKGDQLNVNRESAYPAAMDKTTRTLGVVAALRALGEI